VKITYHEPSYKLTSSVVILSNSFLYQFIQSGPPPPQVNTPKRLELEVLLDVIRETNLLFA